MQRQIIIRGAIEQDIEAILDIWLYASRSTHSFIPFEFWLSQAEDMKNIYLPRSETYVHEVDKRPCGFISLVDDHLAALFVHPKLQGRGYGKQLLDFAKHKRKALTLGVYSQNIRAVRFYEEAGFRVLEERLETHAAEPELVMRWDAKVEDV